MDDQGGEGEGGQTRDGQEGVVIGKHRRFAGDLLAEQDGALGAQQRLVGDHAAIGAGKLAQALGDEGIRQRQVVGESLDVKARPPGDEASDDRRSEHAADALGGEEDDDEAQDVGRPFLQRHHQARGHGGRQEERTREGDEGLAQIHLGRTRQVRRPAVHDGAKDEQRQGDDVDRVLAVRLHHRGADEPAEHGRRENDQGQGLHLVVLQSQRLEEGEGAARLLRQGDAEDQQRAGEVHDLLARQPADVEERALAVELENDGNGDGRERRPPA